MAEYKFFSDNRESNLRPLTILKKSQELRCGMLTLEEKASVRFAGLRSPYTYLLNSRVIIDDDLFKAISSTACECAFVQGDAVVAAAVSKTKARIMAAQADLTSSSLKEFDLPVRKVSANMVDDLWDLVYSNCREIQYDIRALGLKPFTGSMPGVFCLNKKDIFIAKDAVIKPSVVIDAETGPVVIDEGAKVLPNSTIMGPVYIGKGSIVKAGSKLYQGVSIGPMCKVGGELEETVFSGYSNKQHEGFIGHSYIGQWINLGANTNNSDLKNNYKPVKLYVNGKLVDSGKTFLGTFIGDHTKVGINTMFNTGTVVGACSNVYGSGFQPKFIPSFAWGGGDSFVEHNVEKAVETAKAVMKRRKITLSKDEEKKIRQAFTSTAKERKDLIS